MIRTFYTFTYGYLYTSLTCKLENLKFNYIMNLHLFLHEFMETKNSNLKKNANSVKH